MSPTCRRVTASLLFLLPLLASAQTHTFRGQVLDQATRQPVEFANVSVWSADSVLLTGALTDGRGTFTIPGVAWRGPGGPVVRVQFVGYQTTTVRPTVGPQDDVSIPPIYLALLETALREVTVRGEREAAALQLDKQVIQTKQFQNAANGTGLDLLRRLPSVTVNAEGALTLRGNANVQVLVNGKPSNRTAAEVLSQLPANVIETVELITSPSARYDSEGRAGLINVITKQGVVRGWSLTANAMGAGIDPLRFGGDATVSYTGRRWNAYAGADYRRFDIDGYRVGVVRTRLRDTLTYLPSAGIRNYVDRQMGFRAGASFVPNARHAFSLGLYGGTKQTDRTADLHYDEFIRTGANLDLFQAFSPPPFGEFFNQNLFVRSGQFQAVNADYVRTFANKSKLTLLGLFEYSVLGGPLQNRNTVEGAETLLLAERSDERSPLRGGRLQLDYALPLSHNRKLETGYQWRTLHHAGTFDFDRLNLATNQWVPDPAFTDRLDLYQRIHAAYAQFSGGDKRLNYSAGLRAEYTDRDLTHRLGRQPYRYEALHVFPSAQLLWVPTDAAKWRVAYTRRIDRPTTKTMSPFKNHRHAETIELGDPNLRPELADVAEVSYTRSAKAGYVTLTGYFNRVTDKIFRVNDIESRTILWRTFTNAGNATSVGLELLTEFRPVTNWKVFLSGNLYHFAVRGEYLGLSLDQRSVNYNLTATSTLTWGKVSLQADANYVSRTVTTQGWDSGLLLANLGAKVPLWRGRGTLGAQLLNVFNSNLQTITTQSLDFYSSTDYRKFDRVLQLSLGLLLNDSGKKAKALKTEYGERDF